VIWLALSLPSKEGYYYYTMTYRGSNMQCAVLITLLTILTLVSSEDFRIGMLLTRTNWTATAMFSELRLCFIKYGEEVEDAATVVYRHFQAAVGKTLPEVREAVPRDDYFSSMSHTLNACSSSEYILSDNPDKARLRAREEARKELILHMALSLMPDNYMAVKNLAYELEWIPTVDVSTPLSLLNDCRAVMDFVDPGLVLQSTFVVPTLIWDQCVSICLSCFHSISLSPLSLISSSHACMARI
jgi:hypothetical protein